ncbi:MULTISPECIES: type I polyketide synthase [Streptomyces]|uniref:type I polyketide synthase n=1 Tax=Streptomyces olivaceoviridis TaxID=1921 RepID=UPI001677A55C|nr:type I polyketide synthase [Streptomyces canarius]
MTRTDPSQAAIAVIGYSCRLPGAPDPDAFWRLMLDKRHAITEAPADRWTSVQLKAAKTPHAASARWGGFIEHPDAFDATFFNVSPREAAAMDPQQRLVLELGWEAVEHGGLLPAELAGSRTGVFVAAGWDDYATLRRESAGDITHHTLVGTQRALIANRLSHMLGVRGPSQLVDTGQSSSLVAVHLACQSLRSGESTTALAGGVNLNLALDTALVIAGVGALSPEGRCHTFDARADGYVRGEGGALVLLKLLDQAIADGDTIHGVLLGSAVNHDGDASALTVPDAEAQRELVTLAQRAAGVSPADVDYVELHGTGTKVGDPVEAAALGASTGSARPAGSPLLVGSAKTNIGHLESAAGVVGLLKAVLAVRHGEIPASLNFDTPPPGIPLDELNLEVLTERTPWGADRRIAGVTSLGLGGANCHVVVASYQPPGIEVPTAPQRPAVPGAVPLVVSGRTPAALRAQAARLADWIDDHPGTDHVDLGGSLLSSRTLFEHRAVSLGAGGLRTLAAGRADGDVVTGSAAAPVGKTVFVFPGQGSQWVGMGRELLLESPVFRARMAECEQALAPFTDWRLSDALRDADALRRTEVVQPVLWAIMVSLAAVWRSLGVVPDAVLGHSQGEVAAAVVAGALSLEDGARLVALRSKALRELTGRGGMTALALSVSDARALMGPELSIAAVNGPSSVVVAGPPAALAEVEALAEARDVRARRVPISYASHSAQIDEIKEELLHAFGEVTPRECGVAMFSTVDVDWVDGTALDAGYWYRNLRRTVEFEPAVRHLSEAGYGVFIEVSAHPVLASAVEESVGDVIVAGTLRRDDGGWDRLKRAAAELFVRGVDVDWSPLLSGAARVALPTYSFQRQSYWFDRAAEPVPAATVVADTGLPALTDLVRSHAAAVLGYSAAEEVDVRLAFKALGFDSTSSLELRGRLAAATGLRLPAALVYNHPTVEGVAAFLHRALTGADDTGTAAGPADRPQDEPVAIVAMSCRLPGGVRSPADLWRLVESATDAVGPLPEDRGWDLEALLGEGGNGTSDSGFGGFLQGVGEFDADFFGISPREAAAMDPQQRLLLETSWEAFERAGIVPSSLRGSATGVFVGAMGQDYLPRLHELPAEAEGYGLVGGAGSVASGRLSYTFGLRGPAVTVDTACSSSLVALHMAARSLRAGECSLALAAGATVMAGPGMLLEFSRQNGLATDGRCRSFSDDAAGTGWSEGVAVLVLERLSDARRNGHPVLALVRGSAVNQDGASNGLTAPHGPSQEDVIREALANARLTAAEVDAVEAHGTGTRLGDPIEAEALIATYGQDREGPVWLGSLKSNIGHTQAAAGIAGVIKMVEAMRHATLPRTLHVRTPSSRVDWSAGAVRLLTEQLPWRTTGRPRRAGVSSFGVSGTNAHVVLEEAPPAAPTVADDRPDASASLPWILSARSAQALRRQAAGLAAHLATAVPRPRPLDVGYSLATERTAFEDRAVLLGGPDALPSLAQAAPDEAMTPPGVVRGRVVPGARTVFVFPGQGSQWAGMALDLARSAPVFAEQLRACEDALAPYVDWSLSQVLAEPGQSALLRVDVVQPALFAVMVSLAALWRSHGVRPDLVVGHSQGEIAAAVVAGALTLEDGARVVALRSQALRALAGRGGMVSVAEPEEAAVRRVARWEGRLAVAAVNGPGAVVVSGDPEALDELLAECEAEGCRARRIPVDYASHSAHVEEIREAVIGALGGMEPRRAEVPFLSTVTGAVLDGTELDAEYWYRNLRGTVRFGPAVADVLVHQSALFIEVSPHPVLMQAISESLDRAPDRPAAVLCTLRRGDGGHERFLASLAEAYVHGAPVDWAALYEGSGARPTELPTYPFERRRYWLDTMRATATATAPARPGPHAWRYRVTWTPRPDADRAPAPDALSGRWLVAVPEALAGDPYTGDVTALLAAYGADVRSFSVTGADDRAVLAARLRSAASDESVAGVLSLLALDELPCPGHPAAPGGLVSTVALLQALGDTGIPAPLWLATRGAVAVDPTERLTAAAQSLVWGLGRVAGLEHADRWGGLVDLPDGWDERTRARLAAVLAGLPVDGSADPAHGTEDQVAVRAAGVSVRRLTRAVGSVRPGARTWRPGGTTLITGGTGALGAHVARRLAAHGAEHLLLVGRAGPQAPGAEELRRELEELGSRVTVAACDVADRAALATLLDTVPREHPLTAIVHAAAVLDDDTLAALRPEQIERALRPKMAGALHLHELTRDLDLDAFVLFSSVAGTFGIPGQGNYAPGNAFVDALAEQRRAEGLVATSIAFGPWAGAGMAGRAGVGDLLARHGLHAMAPADAVAAMQRAVDDDETCLTVADIDWDRFFLAFTASRARPLLHDVPEVRRIRSVATAAEEPGAAMSTLARRLAGASEEERGRLLLGLVRDHVAAVLGHTDAAAVPADRSFKELGFDSLTGVEVRNRLGAATGLRLPATVVYDHPTPAALVRHLRGELAGGAVGPAPEPLLPAPPAAEEDPIAVVAMSCRFPGGVRTPDDLWRLVSEGADAVGAFPADRGWDLDALYHPDPAHPGTTYVREGAFLHDAADFDADFFGISPREALAMDPQQRVLLETSWEVLERAGIDPTTLRGSRTAVFAGTNGQDYPALLAAAPAEYADSEGYGSTGAAASVVSGRVSYALGLEGPAVTVDTACSSALVALHLACQSLRQGECELALAGGVTVMSTPGLFVSFSRQQGLAPDGRAKAYAAAADGTSWGEGVGVVLLERLSDARRRGHPVLALVRGSAVNQDGASNGLAAPNGPSQQRVITAALAAAGLRAEDVDAVEGHGTGTRLGDPIEAQALIATYGQGRTEERPVWLGSVKSNIGHTQAAAGVAGVIKMIMAMRHGVLPRSLHLDAPSGVVDWTAGAVRPLAEARPWQPRTGAPRRFGVSAFGISGTNAHVILEQPPQESKEPAGAPAADRTASGARLFPLAAKGRAALREQAASLLALLEAESVTEDGLTDVAYSLATTRAALPDRAVVLAEDRDGLVRALGALAAGRPSAGVVQGTARDDAADTVAFLFTGQGSQRVGMGAELSARLPAFAAAFDEVCAELDRHLDRPLRRIVDEDAEALGRTEYAQPALFAVEVALFRVLRDWGVRPLRLVGHSVGELAAAHAAGVLSLSDAAVLVTARGRLMQAQRSDGAMLAVQASADEVADSLAEHGDRVAVAAVNAPGSVVLSGDSDAVAALEGHWRERGRRTKLLRTSHAFHSSHLDGMLAEYERIAATLDYSPPRIPVVSTVTGADLTAEEACSPAYWARQARETVRFSDAVRTLRAVGVTTFVEIGPDGVLSGMVSDCLPEESPLAVPLLRDGRPEEQTLLSAVARLHTAGVTLDWEALFAGAGARRRPLPTYPFQHKRFWPQVPAGTTAAASAGQWHYRIGWTELTALREPAGAEGPDSTWLALAPDTEDGNEALAACRAWLERLGTPVVLVAAGTGRDTLAERLRDAAVRGPVSGVLSLLALDDRPHPDHPAVPTGLAGTLTAAQALTDAKLTAPLWVVTQSAVTVDQDQDTARPEQAQTWGLGQVLGLEQPELWGGLVDLPADPDESALARLGAAVTGGGDEDQLAVRAAGVHGRRLERAPAPAAGPAWQPRGTVLITGGTGALGRHVAVRLAHDGAEHLVLTSRHGPDAPGAAALHDELAALGVRVTIEACDVTDRDAVAALLATYPPTAVVHTAGALVLGSVADDTPAAFEEAAAAKVTGARHLDELLGDTPLDAFVLFSSVAGVWGSGRQGAYAAANAYLDALAARRRARGLAAVSVAWGPWGGGGMADEETLERLRRHGLAAMAPAVAVAALAALPAGRDAAVVVADVRWEDFVPSYTAARPRPLIQDLAEVRSVLDDPEEEPAPPASALAARLAGLPSARREEAVRDLVRDHVAAVLGHDSAEGVAVDRVFRDLGFDSLTAVELRDRLVEATGVRLPVTEVFDHPTVADLADRLHAELSGTASGPDTRPAATDVVRAAVDEPLAIVSMACRLPGGVASPEDLWRLVADGEDAIGPLPTGRGWDLERLYHPDPDHEGTFYARGGGFLDGAGDFDAAFFGISPREALAMDPQQRLLLETSWEALERAGIDPASLRGTQGGVFMGVAAQGYGSGPAEGVEGHLLSGTVTSVASGRIAYTLGTEGPAVTVETACSSSLVALHLAGQSLRSGECAYALVGGAAVMASPDVFVEFSRQRGLSPDGRCRSFAEGADGTGWSEGVGVLVVERLSDARRNGHPVLAVIRGSAVNQDGSSNGLTAPNGLAQQRVIRQALANARLQPADVQLVEAHGTGTSLGDPIEAQALLAAYGQDRDEPLWLGSLKSNIGHTQAAAGVAAVIKTVMAMRHGTLPRTLYAEEPSTRIDWTAGNVRLLTEARPWAGPRRAGVSAFGMSGTNAHVVLEQAEPPEAPALAAPDRAAPLLLSARTAGALRERAAGLHRLLSDGDVRTADVAWTLAGTSGFERRMAVLGTDRAALLSGLAAPGTAPNVVTGRAGSGRTVFVFPGQGTQWTGMALELAEAEPVFGSRLDACAEALAPHVDWSLREVLADEAALRRVDVVQPALFAVMVSLAELWRSYGVRPDAVMGHSQGEIAAAVVAGVLGLDDGAKTVALRSQAIRRSLAGKGGMVSVAADEKTVRELLGGHEGRIGVAAINGPQAIVVSGAPEALDVLVADCEARGVRARRVPVDYASHSAHVEQTREELLAALADVRPTTGEVPLLSTVVGDFVDGTDLGAEYWYRNLREPVALHAATERLLRTGHTLFIEVGPHPVLVSGIEGTAADTGLAVTTVGTLLRGQGGPDRMRAALAEAWTAGADVDRTALTGPGRHVELPTYPFQREHYWLPTPGRTGTPRHQAPELLYRTEWRALPEQGVLVPLEDWAVVVPDGGHPVAAALPGTVTTDVGLKGVTGPVAGVLCLLPPADIPALVRALDTAGIQAPLWCVTTDAERTADQAAVWGLGQVIGLEQPERWGGLVDLPADLDDEVIRRLRTALAGTESQVRVRADGTYARRLVRVPQAAPPTERWAPGHVLVRGADAPLGVELTDWLERHGAEGVRVCADPTAPPEADERTVIQIASAEPPAGPVAETVVTVPAELTGAGDTFVLLHPLSGVWGAARQSAATARYAGLAARVTGLRSRGVRAVTVAVGGWEAQAPAERPVPVDAVMTAVRRAVERDEPALVVADVDWELITSGVSTPRQLSLVSELPDAAVEEGSDDLVGRLSALPEADQRRALLDLVVEQVGATLGHDTPGAVRPDAPFADIGFDSLLAVQFRNRLSSATGLAISPTVVFDHPTPVVLADHLHGELLAGPDPVAPMLAELDRLERALGQVPVVDEISTRLHTLLRRWNERSAPADAGELSSASADELFDLLDNDFGTA